MQHAQVLEHPGRDPDRRRREGGADKDGGGQRVGDGVLVAVPAGAPVEKAKHEGHRDPDGGHRAGRRSIADHRFQVRLEPDLEQQDDDADFREQPEDRCERIVGGRRDHLEQPRPEDDPGQELTHHRRLSHPLERLAGELADQEHHREDGEEARHVEVARRAEEERETRGERPPAGGRARGAASP